MVHGCPRKGKESLLNRSKGESTATYKRGRTLIKLHLFTVNKNEVSLLGGSRSMALFMYTTPLYASIKNRSRLLPLTIEYRTFKSRSGSSAESSNMAEPMEIVSLISTEYKDSVNSGLWSFISCKQKPINTHYFSQVGRGLEAYLIRLSTMVVHCRLGIHAISCLSGKPP